MVEQLQILGVLLCPFSNTSISVDYRLCKAEALYWKHANIYRGPGALPNKIRAWTRGPATSVLFGACSWHLNKEVLQTLRVWEWRFIRKTIGWRRKPDQGQMQFNEWTSRKIWTWFQKTKQQPLYLRVPQSCF